MGVPCQPPQPSDTRFGVLVPVNAGTDAVAGSRERRARGGRTADGRLGIPHLPLRQYLTNSRSDSTESPSLSGSLQDIPRFFIRLAVSLSPLDSIAPRPRASGDPSASATRQSMSPIRRSPDSPTVRTSSPSTRPARSPSRRQRCDTACGVCGRRRSAWRWFWDKSPQPASPKACAPAVHRLSLPAVRPSIRASERILGDRRSLPIPRYSERCSEPVHSCTLGAISFAPVVVLVATSVN